MSLTKEDWLCLKTVPKIGEEELMWSSVSLKEQSHFSMEIHWPQETSLIFCIIKCDTVHTLDYTSQRQETLN